jgi:predicted Zn-dependent peptidase
VSRGLSLDIHPEIRTLDNGLAVAVVPMRGVPLVGMCVLYKVGFRLEPRGRAGFAHLFEHLMFEGTPKLPKGRFDRLVEASGGSNNGQTRPDTTVYEDTLPPGALDRFLYLEADRMRGLALTQETLDNQRDVVKEEIRVNVQNDPYGLFEFGELPGALFDRWENAHDGYGDFADLGEATVSDAAAFFAAFYRPRNAVLALAGDVDPEKAFALAERRFGDVAPGPAPSAPDLLEPPRTAPVVVISPAPLASTPALAAGWRMPPREHEDVVPLLVAGELLHDGRAARLYRGLVEGRQIATEVSGGFNPFQGGVLYRGTTLFLSRISFRRDVAEEIVLAALAEEIASLAQGMPEKELARTKTKLVGKLLASLEPRLEMAIELAHAVAFDGSADALLSLPARILAVTPQEIARAAERWLGPDRRAVIVKRPGRAEEAEVP